MSPRRDKKRIEPDQPVDPAPAAAEPSRRQRRKQAKAGRGPKGAASADPSDVLAGLTNVSASSASSSAPEPVPASHEAEEIAALTTRHRTAGLTPSKPEPIAPRMRAFRLPALLVVIGLLVAAVLVERGQVDDASVATAPTDLSRLMPVASAADASSSTFYCAGGTARGSTDPVEPESESEPDDEGADTTTTTAESDDAADETTGTTTTGGAGEGDDEPPAIVAEHSVLIGNLSDTEQEVVVTAIPSEGDSVTRTTTVAARTRSTVVLSDLVTAPFASALVETDGGSIAVEHQVEGPAGRSIAPCASSASDVWYFPAGTTRLGTQHVYTVFNPFPQQAVVDLAFMVSDESERQVTRRSDQLEGIVVPPGRVVAVDITDIITVNDQVATTITTRSGAGRVIVDQLQVSDGRGGWPENLALTLGAPAPAATWLFADNRPLGEGVETSFVAFNPGSVDAELEVYAQVDGLSVTSTVEPYVVTVRAGQYAIVPVGTDSRIPAGFSAFVVAVSRNDVPIVVERVMKQTEPVDPDGVALTMGSPLVAREWLVPVGGVEGQEEMQVSIANPSVSESVTLTVEAVGEGDAAALEDYDEVSLAPGTRTVVDLSDAQGAAALMLRVRSSGPVVVGQWFAFDDPGTLSSTAVLPVVGTLALPGGEITDRASLGIEEPEPFDGPLPPATSPPGTAPGTTVEPPGTTVPEETTTTTAPAEPPVTDPATGEPVDPAAPTTDVPPA